MRIREIRIADVIPETFFDLDAAAMKERMQKIVDERVIDPKTSLVRYSQADLGSCFRNVGALLRDSMMRYERDRLGCRRAG